MAVFSASVFGGSISAILINIPGTPGAIVTQLEGYAMTRAGRPGEALTCSLLASTLGGIAGLSLLMLVAPLVAGAAMQFRSPEFAMATVFGLTMLAYSTPGSTFRGLLSGLVGLICGMVGFDVVTDVARFDFGTSTLQAGIELVPLTVGLFGLAEVLRGIESGRPAPARPPDPGALTVTFARLRRLYKSVLRGSALGALIGAIPAAGSAIAVAVSYAQEQRLSARPRRLRQRGRGGAGGSGSGEQRLRGRRARAADDARHPGRHHDRGADGSAADPRSAARDRCCSPSARSLSPGCTWRCFSRCC